MTKAKTKSIPMNAFKFAATGAELGEPNADGSVNVKLVALSGEPIQHWWFGQVVQDLSGMKVKPTISIDYCHNDNELIGVADQFNTENNQLEITGQIIPFEENDRASEVIFRSQKGTPYEASIFFPSSKPGDTKIEELDAGESAEVNGQTVHGPITIFREWPLRRVAICPSGADGDTLAMAQSTNDNQNVEVEIMAKPDNKEPEKTPEVVPEKQTAEPEKVATPEVKEPKAEPAKVPSVTEEIAKFSASFGDELGFQYLKEGKSFAEAQSAFNLEMLKVQAENKELKEKAQTVITPEPFNPSGDGDEKFWTTADHERTKQFCQKFKSIGAKYEDIKALEIAKKKQAAQ